MTDLNVQNNNKYLVDLASKKFNGKILFSTDEWFGITDHLLHPNEPIFIKDKYTEYGKWMDGWETRRKRIPGHDWCIIELGLNGFIQSIHLNTLYFTGNHAPRISIQGANLNNKKDIILLNNIIKSIKKPGTLGTCASLHDLNEISKLQSNKWTEIVSHTELKPGYPSISCNIININKKEILNKYWTHIRLNIYPDGGIARLRMYGYVFKDWSKHIINNKIDLISILNGGMIIDTSNEHYGKPIHLLYPGRGINMGDGWETSRNINRPPILKILNTTATATTTTNNTNNNNNTNSYFLDVPGKEWVIVKLATNGFITNVEIDTCHFKGNYPESAEIYGTYLSDDSNNNNKLKNELNQVQWIKIVERTKLEPDKQHYYNINKNIQNIKFNFIKLIIYPDGGISRLRIYGYPEIMKRNKL